ncbi:RecQ family ATP-dependent DNA helicase [uncultured Deefgea sp.]|uniref:RecQ family ATP-dependent DNA helicase n=1 Tax=uncultured Deefgea sp. TaxID=1304914 RepID=UPI0025983C36|nr:RecQ family ATP-dependent DNA helicase [uncultured Deefgea sp.]
MALDRYTSSYTGFSANFAIQNIPDCSTLPSADEERAFNIVFNILHRGIPTRPSPHLSESLKALCGWENQPTPKRVKHPAQRLSLPKVNEIKTPPEWLATIKGHDASGSFPAVRFFNHDLPKALPEFAFITHLLRPECPFDEIVSIESDSPHTAGVSSQYADFYLPDAGLVIEIDGCQHEQARWNDARRDAFLRRYGIKVLRISTTALSYDEGSPFPAWAKELKSILETDHTFSMLYASIANETEDQIENELLLLPVSVIRLQVLLLELLRRGALSLSDNSWTFQVRGNEASAQKALELAIEDVMNWLKPLYVLLQIEFNLPSIVVHQVSKKDEWLNTPSLRIDESVRYRWTDAASEYADTIFIRSDYAEFKHAEISTTQSRRKKLLDHFVMRASPAKKYDIEYAPEGESLTALQNLLYYLFGYERFNTGQTEIISATLRLTRTIGLLPTGGGKSITFQLPVLLQSGPSIVVSPIKSLMDDQVMDLQELGMNRATRISSDTPSAEREYIQNAFTRGRIFLMYISPERLQMPRFREAVSVAHLHRQIMYAVVDEAHCVSEWGHDFRTSYLALASTFARHLPGASILAVTATASENVLRDIQRMFDIEDHEVHSRMELGRPELNFQVAEISGSVSNALLEQLKDKQSIFSSSKPSGSGLVFFPHVNGKKGCYPMAGTLSQEFGDEVGCYAGSAPKIWAGTKQEWDEYKRKTQVRFKGGDIRLICATKAFGMGINKRDVRFTIHFGLPSSIEALYQEGGRAGRDGNNADALVLFTKEVDNRIVEKLSSEAIRSPDRLVDAYSKIKADRKPEGDFLSQFWFISKSVSSLKEQFNQIRLLRNHLQDNGGFADPDEIYGGLQIFDKDEACHKAIYRLHQLGYVEDWTVNYEADRKVTMDVDFRPRSLEELHQNLLAVVRRYEGSDAEEQITRHLKGGVDALGPQTEDDAHLAALILWAHDKFVYNRVQSLLNLYTACDNFDSKHPELFRLHLESFFRRNGTTARIQGITNVGIEGIEQALQLLYKDEKTLQFRDDLDVLLTIHAPLTRFLESYRNSCGLNLAIGLCNLLMRRYDDPNGYSRFSAAVEYLKCDGGDWRKVATSILNSGKNLDEEQKYVLGHWTMKAFGTDLSPADVFKQLGDAASLRELVQQNLSPVLDDIHRSLQQWTSTSTH